MQRPLRNKTFSLNLLEQKVSIFPITDGETIKVGDLVVVNVRTLQACRAGKEGGCYAVGRAVRIVKDENGSESVICNDGIFSVNNTDLPGHKVSDSDIGRICYFDSGDSVTMDSINTAKAGEVLNTTEDGRVLIRISMDEEPEQFLLNPLRQKVSIFPIADGKTVKVGDLVVVNTRTLQACRAKKEGGYYAIGRAARIVMDENGAKSVICVDGIFIINSTDLPGYKVLDSNVGRVCYFDGEDSVTMDNINTTKAGEVLNAYEEDGYVIVKISISEGSELEW